MKPPIIQKLENGSILGLLETDVSIVELLDCLSWDDARLDKFYRLKSEKKKKEWLGVRILLSAIFDSPDFKLNYDEQGKPFLEDPHCKISISHSGKNVCVLISQKLNVGVDVQVFKTNIKKGIGLFMSEKELADCTNKMDATLLHIYWGAKEAIYKLIGLKKTNIKTDIYIFPFKSKVSGMLKGKFAGRKIINLNYQLTDDFCLVYTV